MSICSIHYTLLPSVYLQFALGSHLAHGISKWRSCRIVRHLLPGVCARITLLCSLDRRPLGMQQGTFYSLVKSNQETEQCQCGFHTPGLIRVGTLFSPFSIPAAARRRLRLRQNHRKTNAEEALPALTTLFSSLKAQACFLLLVLELSLKPLSSPWQLLALVLNFDAMTLLIFWGLPT